MSLLSLVRGRLEALDVLDISGAAGLAKLLDDGVLPPRTPAVYVVPVSNSPGGNLRDTGAYLQWDVVTIGVVMVIAARNTRLGDGLDQQVEDLRTSLRSLLFGWQPAPEWDPFWLGPGEVRLLGGGIWISEEFVTQRLEDSNGG